jgi:hypothetical protein
MSPTCKQIHKLARHIYIQTSNKLRAVRWCCWKWTMNVKLETTNTELQSYTVCVPPAHNTNRNVLNSTKTLGLKRFMTTFRTGIDVTNPRKLFRINLFAGSLSAHAQEMGSGHRHQNSMRTWLGCSPLFHLPLSISHLHPGGLAHRLDRFFTGGGG